MGLADFDKDEAPLYDVNDPIWGLDTYHVTIERRQRTTVVIHAQSIAHAKKVARLTFEDGSWDGQDWEVDMGHFRVVDIREDGPFKGTTGEREGRL